MKAMLDMFFSMMLIFCLLFILSFMMISKKEDSDIKKPPIRMLINVAWDGKSNSDVDTWVQDPMGNKIFFRNKEYGHITLERDDTGFSTDSTIGSLGEEVQYEHNVETTTVREWMDGEYVVAVHLYRRGYQEEDVKVHVKMQLLVPAVKLIQNKTTFLSKAEKEITIVTLVVMGGEIIDMREGFTKIVDVLGSGIGGTE